MYSVGVFTTERSLRHIMLIDQKMQEHSNITYLPYSSPEHLKYLYEQNSNRFDGFLFTGSYPYNVLRKEFGPLSKPHAHCNVSDGIIISSSPRWPSSNLVWTFPGSILTVQKSLLISIIFF